MSMNREMSHFSKYLDSSRCYPPCWASYTSSWPSFWPPSSCRWWGSSRQAPGGRRSRPQGWHTPDSTRSWHRPTPASAAANSPSRPADKCTPAWPGHTCRVRCTCSDTPTCPVKSQELKATRDLPSTPFLDVEPPQFLHRKCFDFKFYI